MRSQYSAPRLASLPLAIAFSLAGVNAYAQGSDGIDSGQIIESLVVVGSTTNTVITPAALEKYQANDLADIFRHVPSVSVGGSLGMAQKIYVRGLEDTLLNVTVDGAPQTGTLFHHIGRVSIEPELLKQVEVQAGAGEATSGAGTIGGALRFKTKDVNDLLDDGQQFGGMFKAGYFSNNGYKASGTVYGNVTENWGVLASYIDIDRDNMDDGDGEELFGTSAEQSLTFIKASGSLGAKQTLSISYELRKEKGQFGARPNWPTLEGDTLYPMEGERETFVINHGINISDLINLETSLYHTESNVVQNRFDRWGRYGAEIKTYGFDLRNSSLIGNHKLTYGVDYRDNQVVSQYLDAPSVWQDWAWDPAIGLVKETGSVSGAYIQDHWQLSEQLLLSYGLRYDKYELEQITYSDDTASDGVSANIGLAYNFTDEWTLSLGYAEAMRGKEVGDAFTVEHAPGRISLQPNLQAEEVENTELGIEYDDGLLMASASVYRTKINNVIKDQIGRGAFPQDGNYYENIGEVNADGFELMAGYQWDNFSIVASYNESDTELNGHVVEGYENNGLGNSRGDTFNFNLAYSISDNVEMGWNFAYVNDLNDIEVFHRSVDIGWIAATQEINKPGYDVHDFYLQWKPAALENLTIDFSVQNVFDEHYRDHSSVGDYTAIPSYEGVAGLYEAGRDVRVTASYKF